MIQEEHEISEELNDETTENHVPVEGEFAEEPSSIINELDEQKDKYMRLLAEFENFKRRTSRERIELFKTAGQEVIKDLLPALDDIDRAQIVVADSKDIEAVKQGLQLIAEKLKNIMQQKGLQEIECKGLEFNTDKMEAITEIPAPNDALKGKVVEVLEKGYTLNDKIIRYAKVVIGK